MPRKDGAGAAEIGTGRSINSHGKVASREKNLSFVASDLSPYSSHIIARSQVAMSDLKDQLELLLIQVIDVISETIEMPRAVTGNAKVSGTVSSHELVGPWPTAANTLSVACVYVEERPVTWLPAQAGKDKLHHLVVLTANADGLLLITATDADHRSVILARILSGYFSPWAPIPQQVLVKALVDGHVMKTLWLSGVHRDTPVKPSSKIISGSNLRDAIDPIIDSSYLAGAVRSTVGGVSLRNSSVWTGSNTTIQEFDARADSLLQLLNKAILASPAADLPVHIGLAQWVDKVADASGCYFVDHADAETLESGQDRLRELTEQFVIELAHPGAPSGKPVWAFTVNVTDLVTQTSTQIVVEPEMNGFDRRVSFSVDNLPVAPFDKWANAITTSPSFLRAYYDTGHTIAGAAMSHTRIQDFPFGGFLFADFTHYDVKKEKPDGTPKKLQDMMTPGDNSLFKWIFKDGLTKLGFNQPTPGACWLFCDDGASEVADFVYLDISGPTKRLALFHAKGASSSSNTRLSAPGPYELVSAQAIKNLRALNAQELLARVNNRLDANGKRRIWDRPWQPNLQPMTNTAALKNALKGLGSNYECYVVIVQPHVRKSNYLPSKGGGNNSVGARQLRTLLFGVESLAHSQSAIFKVIADQR